MQIKEEPGEEEEVEQAMMKVDDRKDPVSAAPKRIRYYTKIANGRTRGCAACCDLAFQDCAVVPVCKKHQRWKRHMQKYLCLARSAKTDRGSLPSTNQQYWMLWLKARHPEEDWKEILRMWQTEFSH